MISRPRAWRRLLWWTAAVLLAVTAAVVVAPLLLSRGLVGRSFAGSMNTGSPRRVVVGEPVAEDWLAGHAAQFGERTFTVAWDGWLPVSRAATYEFATASDDGSWLFVDSVLVVNNSGEHAMQERRGAVALPAGLHHIRIDYFQLHGDAQLQVRVSRDGGPFEALRRDALFPTRIAYYLRFARYPETSWRPGYLVATVWSSALLVALVVWAASRVRRHTAAHAADVASNRWLWRLLTLSALLVVWQGHWGLPTGWEVDELRAGEVVPALELGFSNGWYSLYPPVYVYLLGLISLPFKVGAMAGALDLWSPQTVLTEELLYRGTAMLGGLAIVYLAYRCASEAFGDRRAGLWAGFLVAVVPNLVLLAKLAKPDVPYVAAFMAAMLGYLHCLRSPSPAAYGAFAVAGMTAMCIKDQAYGLFVLPALHLIWLRWRLLDGPLGARVGGFVRDPALRRAVGLAVVTFLVAYNLPINWAGARRHFTMVFVGGAGGAFRMYEATLAGHATILREALALVPWMLGWPSAILALLGLAVAWRERRHATIALVLPIVSYYVCFIAVIRYQYDRFYLAPAVLLAMFAGRGLHWLWNGSAVWRKAIVVAAASYALAYGASVDLMMMRDSRYAAETWLEDHVSKTATVGALGPAAYLPRPRGLRFLEIEPDADVLAIVSPEYLVLNAEHAVRDYVAAFYAPLLNGTHPDYRPVAWFKSTPGFAVLAYDEAFSNGREDPLTNLDKINPEIWVFVRRDVAIDNGRARPRIIARALGRWSELPPCLSPIDTCLLRWRVASPRPSSRPRSS